MIERPEDQEQNTPPEPTGFPADLFDDPAKYDGDIPLWRRTVGFIRQYERTRPKKQEALLNQIAISIARNPQILGGFLDNLALIAELKPEKDVEGIQEELIGHIERVTARRADLAKWTPEKIEQLIRVGIDSPGKAKEVAEKMKAALFRAPQNIEEAVDLFYNSAWVAAETTQHDVREELVAILCYEKEWLTETSTSVVWFMLGASGLTDDAHMKKFYATDYARSAVTKVVESENGYFQLNPERLQNLEKRLEDARELQGMLSGPIVAKRIMDLRETRAGRYNALHQYFHNDPIAQKEKRGFEELQRGKRNTLHEAVQSLQETESMIRNLGWPLILKYDPGEPLRKMVDRNFAPQQARKIWEQRIKGMEGFEIITDGPIELTDDLALIVAAKGYKSPEQKNGLIRMAYEELLGDNRNPDLEDVQDVFTYARLSKLGRAGGNGDDVRYLVFTRMSENEAGKLSSIIEYHRPDIPPEQYELIKEQLVLLRKDITTSFTKAVGKRGYEILISDTALVSLGYESISFRQIQGNDIEVQLVLNGQSFNFRLDSEHRIKLGDDVKRFQSNQDQIWLELLTLSHLKKLMCTDEDQLSKELVGGEKQYEYYKKQKMGRIEHLRRQVPGRNFTSDAYIKCLKSDLPVKQLDRINKMRAERGLGGTKETGMWTYISGVERDIDTGQAKPVKIAFANATDDMRKAIPLGEISTEELERIEREILSELEII